MFTFFFSPFRLSANYIIFGTVWSCKSSRGLSAKWATSRHGFFLARPHRVYITSQSYAIIYICVCPCACVHVCMCACVCVCACARVLEQNLCICASKETSPKESKRAVQHPSTCQSISLIWDTVSALGVGTMVLSLKPLAVPTCASNLLQFWCLEIV